MSIISLKSVMNSALVIKKYLEYLQKNNIPDWEISGMLSKYYPTTQALEKAINQ